MDHPTYHPGIWMAFGDISGNDYWRLASRVEQESFIERPQGGPGHGSFAVRNRYLDQNDPSKVICEETCRFGITALPAGYLLTWDSTFSSDREFSFGDQEEMGLGIRVATPLRVEVAEPTLPPPTGTMTDSEGRKNGAKIGGNTADWCDYSGTLDGQPFLAINGVQTLSNQVHAFCLAPAQLHAAGVRRLRLSPHTVDMVEVAKAYRALVDGKEEPEATRFVLSCLDLPGAMVEGYALARPGWQASAPAL